MTFAALKLLLSGLPWRKIAPYLAGVALAVLAWLWYSSTIADAKQAGYDKAKAECIEAANQAKAQADARLADQREQANTAVAEALLTADEYKSKLQGRQNELRKTTANLANCRLSLDTIRVLNDARADTIGHD